MAILLVAASSSAQGQVPIHLVMSFSDTTLSGRADRVNSLAVSRGSLDGLWYLTISGERVLPSGDPAVQCSLFSANVQTILGLRQAIIDNMVMIGGGASIQVVCLRAVPKGEGSGHISLDEKKADGPVFSVRVTMKH
jgi:hypothetical protein